MRIVQEIPKIILQRFAFDVLQTVLITRSYLKNA